MSSVNKVILVGNLGADPEIKYFENGVSKASFSLATTETYTNKNGEKISNTEWHNVVLWRGLAGIAEKWLKKGNKVYIEGKLRHRSWDDADGNKKYITEIEGKEMVMLGSPNQGQGGQSSYNNQAAAAGTPSNNAAAAPAPAQNPVNSPAPASGNNSANDFDDDLPF